MQKEQIKQLIEAGIPGCQAIVNGDDGAPFDATVISEAFAGQSVVKQHQMVYAALKGRMGGELHALALQTSIPEE